MIKLIKQKKIARVFPRKTKASPDDPLAFFGEPPLLTIPEIDEVHISVTFTYDRRRAEDLAYQWQMIGVPEYGVLRLGLYGFRRRESAGMVHGI